MGDYLSQAKTDKESIDEFNDYVEVGASSMQGWRNTQEDAHNAILNYDINTSLFAVYDGHGGAEVATYCAEKFPAFLKSLASYKDGHYEQALKDAFLGFDKKLLDPDIIEALKVIAAEKNADQGEDNEAMVEDDDECENLAVLHEEGTLPLDEVMEKYKGHPSTAGLKKLKQNAPVCETMSPPYMRSRRAAAILADATNKAIFDPGYNPEGSSTSKSLMAGSTSYTIDKTMVTEETESNAALTSIKQVDSIAGTSSNNESTNAPNGSAGASLIKESAQNGSVTSVSVSKGHHCNSEEKTSDNRDHSIDMVEASTLSSNDVHNQFNQNGGSIKTNNNTKLSIDTECATETNDVNITLTCSSKERKTPLNDPNCDDGIDLEPNTMLTWECSKDDDGEEEDESQEEEEDLNEEFDSDGSEDFGYDEDDEEDADNCSANKDFCANMIEEPGKDSGCTAVVALLVGRDLYVANAGDSRCVVCRKGSAVEMSLDHKPEDVEEFDRIVKAGGRVTMDGRVNGGLNLSRALGDHGYKMNAELPPEEQMISAMPDIKKLIITPDDEFMVLACDGIWNFMSSENVVSFIRLHLRANVKKTSEICEELFETCLAPNTMGDGTGCDNMTAIIIRFKPSILELPTKIDATETENVTKLPVVIKSFVHDNGNVAGNATNGDLSSVYELMEPYDDETDEEINKSKYESKCNVKIETEQSIAQKRAHDLMKSYDTETDEEINENKNENKRIKTDDAINVNITKSIDITPSSMPLLSSDTTLPCTLLQSSSGDDNIIDKIEVPASSPATGEKITST